MTRGDLLARHSTKGGARREGQLRGFGVDELRDLMKATEPDDAPVILDEGE